MKMDIKTEGEQTRNEQLKREEEKRETLKKFIDAYDKANEERKREMFVDTVSRLVDLQQERSLRE